MDNYDYLFKIIIIGDSDTGKTSLLNRFSNDEFKERYISTIGIDFKIRSIIVDEKHIKIQVWDTAGQERFKNITTSYYRGSHGIMLVFDLTDNESFNNLVLWMNECYNYASPNAIKVLVGTKCDLTDKISVSKDKIEKFAKDNELIYMETSSKTSYNVEEIFLTLIKHIKITFEYTHKIKDKNFKKIVRETYQDPVKNKTGFSLNNIIDQGSKSYNEWVQYC